MTGKEYSPKQEAMAERIARAMSNVPEERLPMMETIVESFLIGAGIATMNGAAEKQASA